LFASCAIIIELIKVEKIYKLKANNLIVVKYLISKFETTEKFNLPYNPEQKIYG